MTDNDTIRSADARLNLDGPKAARPQGVFVFLRPIEPWHLEAAFADGKGDMDKLMQIVGGWFIPETTKSADARLAMDGAEIAAHIIANVETTPAKIARLERERDEARAFVRTVARMNVPGDPLDEDAFYEGDDEDDAEALYALIEQARTLLAKKGAR